MGQKAKFYMRLLRQSETGRGSKDEIIYAAIKVDRNWDGVKGQNSH